MNRRELIKERVYSYQELFKRDLSLLIKQASWRDSETISQNNPFGIGVTKVFNIMKQLCIRERFAIKTVGNYAFHTTLEREIPVKIALSGHLDTVSINDKQNWNSPPLSLYEKDGILYGLGVNDNKGPSLVCLYVLKIIKELDLLPKNSLRIIYGGAEETTWECIQEYKKHFEDPEFVIVSDGNFPLVHIEKGIIRVKIELFLEELERIDSDIDYGTLCKSIKGIYQNQSFEIFSEEISSRHPYRGNDALNKWAEQHQGIVFDFIKKWDDGHGATFGVAYKTENIPKNYSNTFALIGAKGENNKLIIYGDIRYMTLEDRTNILLSLQKEIDLINGSFEITLECPLIHEPKDSKLVQTLLQVYQEITNDTSSPPLVMGAMSYARAFKRAIAFGPCFPNYNSLSHRANESMPINHLLDTIIIYIESIIRLHEDVFVEE